MIPLYKFPRPEVDRERVREEAFARRHIARQGSEDFARQDFWPLLQRYLRRDQLAVDVQCGTGGWVIFLHDEGYRVDGVDPSRRVAQAISEYAPDIPVRVAPATRLPYADGSVDAVVAIGTLEAQRDRVGGALGEWRRVLREDGTLFIEVPYANPLRRCTYLPLKQFEYILKTAVGRTPAFAGYLFTARELPSLLRRANFALVELVPHELPDPDAHFGLYHDWKLLRGERPYQLNAAGRMVKQITVSLSSWVASTGLFAVAKAVPPSTRAVGSREPVKAPWGPTGPSTG